MSSWFESLKIYRTPRLIAVLFMGFSSGLPLPLTFATLSFWLAEAGISRTQIGLFILLGFSYNYKFLWSPLIDRLPLPWLTAHLGRRRGWAVAIQLPLMLAIFALGQNDPRTDLVLTVVLAVIVSFLSASQDIVIDAYRIELLEPDEQGAGAAATQWGYRFGLLAAGAGALYTAQFGGWHVAYAVMAGLMLVGIATVLLTPEPTRGEPTVSERRQRGAAAWFRTAVVQPFADFMTRPGWAVILLFVVLYKFGDALTGVMANPFYVAMGFSKIEVANISKLVGFFATLGGVALGGVVADRFGLYRSLFGCGLLTMLANSLYVVQAWVGHDTWMLATTIFTDNFAAGMGSAAFVAYLSSLCNVAFTATQYALFSSLAALPTRLLSAPAGWLSDHVSWPAFFFVTTLAALPGLTMVLWLMRRFPDAALPRKPALAGDD
ncbi:MAG: AmpG family muropeptide MFS transporter [Alphaproteobacteria bacterium]|nr:AmpG family muropeptide MFS transporter [Alphaproteobacteria bacterium]